MECPHAHNTHPELGPNCLDHEACMTGTPCEIVRNTVANEKVDPGMQQMRMLLEDWWLDKSNSEMVACVPKAVEYGSTDLAVIGRAQGRMMGRHELSHEEAVEYGIFFYLIGKIARWEDAILHGRRVSDDTLHDIAVYTKMMQRTRDVGGWPIAPEQDH